MEWERVLKDSVKENTIKELHLRHVPILKTAENWGDVDELGLIDHETKYAHYKGVLVKYGERLFYVPEARMQALAPFRPWKSKTKIKVIEPEKK